MELQLPPPLRSGDRVRIVAPCGPFERQRFEAGVELIRRAGFVPVFDDGVFAAHRYLAGDDERRRAELEAAIEDPEARAIWVARGGYGATRLLPHLDPERVAVAPKWLVGFSDVTALHALWARAGIASLHGPNVTTIADWGEEARSRLWSCLAGDRGFTLEGRCAAGGGVVEGVLLGGNLAVLAAMAGTGLLPSLDGAIVALEEVGERPYRLDRALHQLIHAGSFDGVVGFAVGQLSDCGEPPERGADWTARDVVCEILAAVGVPVLADLPFGHEPSSWPLPFGVRARLDGDRGRLDT